MSAVKNDFTCPFSKKTWSAAERNAVDLQVKKAIKLGLLEKATKCNRCGKETGRIDLHNHSYDHPTDTLEQLCQGCHTSMHARYNSKGPNELDREIWQKFMGVGDHVQ